MNVLTLPIESIMRLHEGYEMDGLRPYASALLVCGTGAEADRESARYT